MDTRVSKNKKIYAIVLTYDANIIFVDNLLCKMDRLWPSLNFIFRIPYNSTKPEFLKEKYPKLKIEFKKTPSHIKPTVLTLLSDLDANDWVYWCIDDKFPVDLDKTKVQQTSNWVRLQEDQSISGVSFAKVRRLKKKRNLDEKNKISICEKFDLVKRKSFRTQFWLHQFFRVKVIREVFASFPDTNFRAKDMDAYIKDVCVDPSLRFYVTEKNCAVFCESASRGIATQSLKRSLIECGISNYSKKTFSHTDIVIGHLNSFESYKSHATAAKTKLWRIFQKYLNVFTRRNSK